MISFNIHEIAINTTSNIVKDYQGLIIGFFTILAMVFIDWQNKNRWQKEGYLKRKIDLEISLRQKLLAIDSVLYDLPKLEELKKLSIRQKFKDEDRKTLESLNDAFIKVERKIICSTQTKAGIITNSVNEKYDINLLLEEYKLFNNEVVKFQKYFTEFCKLEGILTSPDDYRVDSYLDLNNAKIPNFINVLYHLKLEIKILIDVLNKNCDCTKCI